MVVNADEVEVDIDIINYLNSNFESDYGLINDIYNLFEVIGVQDIELIDECMVSIFKNKITPNTIAEFEEEEEKIIEQIRDASKIKLDKEVYNSLSKAYTTYLSCCYILEKNKIISDEEMEFCMNAIHEIYSIIGRVYSHIACKFECFKKIQSLGGKSRAKKYDEYKREIFNEWEKNSFYSYSKCAREFSEKFDLNPKTIESWLSKKYKKS